MFRNFFHTIRHFKSAFIMNILGLSTAFAASLLITMQLRFDLRFDACYKDAENIYRLDMKYNNNDERCTVSRPLGRRFVSSSPDILYGCIMERLNRGGIYASEDGRIDDVLDDITWVSPGFLKVFGFNMVTGDRDALSEPGAAVIPESMALRMFGTADPTGAMLYAKNNSQNPDIKITGVYKDFPANASIRNIVYMALDRKHDYDNRNDFNYSAFVKLAPEADPERITENFVKNSYVPGFAGEAYPEFFLRPLRELHFIQGISFDNVPKTSRAMVYSLVSVIIVLLVIAGINFNNLSISIAPMRFRGIATKMILGDSRHSIRAGVIIENVSITVFSYILSLLILHLCHTTPVAGLIDADISTASNIGLICIGAAAIMVIGVIIGIYPAFYLTAHSPAETIKGNPGLTPSGSRTRVVLLGFQFVAVFILMTVASFIILQNRYMLKAPLGFDKDEIIVCKRTMSLKTTIGELKRIPGVTEVGFAQYIPGTADDYTRWMIQAKEQEMAFTVLFVDETFLKTMGIDIFDGRDFREGDVNSEYSLAIFNNTARMQYDLHPGEILNDWLQVVGICEDIKFASLRKEVTPAAFVLSPYPETLGNAFVRVSAGTDLKDVREEMEKWIKKTVRPNYPVSVRFYDSILENTYRKEQKTGTLVSLFCLIAILISIIGVFSLVTFECGYRRKESAIRKVVGATSLELVGMFCRKYTLALLVCFTVSVPVSIIVARHWMEGFAYHIPLYWWVFPTVFAAIAAITLATVIWQSWSTANEDPVGNLRTD